MEVTKPTLLFIDPCCPRPYEPSNMDEPGIGGTENTVVALAEGIATKGMYHVVVEQHNRMDGEDYSAKALYTNADRAQSADWAVVLRDPRAMLVARVRFPRARILLWSHDLADRNLGLLCDSGVFKEANCYAQVCVSHWHRQQMIDVLQTYGFTGGHKIRSIYNPISVDAANKYRYDKNKLVWMASPHKGLDRAYEIFKNLFRLNPEFKLYVTNPGYLKDQFEGEPGVVPLGHKSSKEALEVLSDALCLFYPNTVFPETFGKILAEANQLNVPVLTHPFGAAREVLDSHPDQLIDCKDTEGVVKRVLKWHEGQRPIVHGNPRFKLSRVIQEWERLLNDVR